MEHFDKVYSFIEEARRGGGNVLVHCSAGSNRSVALVVAYVMVHKQIGPLSAVKLVYNVRKLILTNVGFREQILLLAKERGLLQLDRELLE